LFDVLGASMSMLSRKTRNIASSPSTSSAWIKEATYLFLNVEIDAHFCKHVNDFPVLVLHSNHQCSKAMLDKKPNFIGHSGILIGHKRNKG